MSQKDPAMAVPNEERTMERVGYRSSEAVRWVVAGLRWSPTAEENHPKGDPALIPEVWEEPGQ